MKIETFPVGIIDTNCYVVTDENSGESLVVDPGDMSAELESTLDGKDIKYILLTHGHYDHILAAAGLKQKTGAPVAIGKEDADCLHDDDLSRAGLHFPLLQQKIHADILLSDGSKLDFGGKKINVIHTPGHTPGGVCYIFEDERVIFSGDTLFRLSAGRTDFETGSDYDMALSLKTLASLSGDYAVYPGHGPATTLDFERKHNPYMRAF